MNNLVNNTKQKFVLLIAASLIFTAGVNWLSQKPSVCDTIISTLTPNSLHFGNDFECGSYSYDLGHLIGKILTIGLPTIALIFILQDKK